MRTHSIGLQTVILALTGTLLLGCGEVLFAEVELPEVCATQVNSVFEGAPAPGVFTAEREFEYPLGGVDPSEMTGFEGTLNLLSLTLTSNQGLQDMGFLHEVRATVAPPAGSSLPEEELISYTQAPGGSTDKTISLAADKFNIFDYLQGESIRIKVVMTGSFPTNEWGVDVRGCLYVKGKYKYFNAITGG